MISDENRQRNPTKSAPSGVSLLALACLTFVIALSRLPAAIGALSGFVINNDEMIMSFTVLDRFLGVPPAFLSWPGGTLQLSALPAVAGYLLTSMHGKFTIAVFVHQLSEAYRQPWKILFIVRCVVAVVSSFGFSTLLYPLARWGVSRVVAVVCIVYFATLPEIWLHSQMAVPDALSLGLGCAGIAAFEFLPPLRGGALSAGICAGLALAAKLTVLPLLPFQLASREMTKKGFAKAAALFAGATIVAFCFAAPYVWTDPLRFAKAVLGNLAREGVPSGPIHSIGRILRLATPALNLMFIPGAYALIRAKRLVALAGATLTLAIVVFLTGRAGVVYDRYFLVALVPMVIVAALGVEWCAEKSQQFWPTRGRLVALGCLVAAGGTLTAHNTWAYVASIRESRSMGESRIALCNRLLSTDPGSTLIVPKDGSLLFERVAGFASSASLEVLASRIPRTPEAIAQFTAPTGLPRSAAFALASALNNQEQILAAHFCVWAFPGNRGGAELLLYSTNDLERLRFGLLSLEEAKTIFQNRKNCDLVLDGSSVGLLSEERFGDYVLLTKHSAEP